MAVQGQEAACPTPAVLTLFWIRLTWTAFLTNTSALVLFPGIPIQYIRDKDQPSVGFKRQQVIFAVQPGLKKHKLRVWKTSCDFGQSI